MNGTTVEVAARLRARRLSVPAPRALTGALVPQESSVRVMPLGDKAARLIVRNLPFNCTQQQLAERFNKCGKITEVPSCPLPRSRLDCTSPAHALGGRTH